MSPADRDRIADLLRDWLPDGWRGPVVSVGHRTIAVANPTPTPPVIATVEWRVSDKRFRGIVATCGYKRIERRGFYAGPGWHQRIVDDLVAAIGEVGHE